MSYGVMAYAVDAEALRAALAARDEALVDVLARRYAAELRAHDRMFGGAPAGLEALRDLLLGRPRRPRAGALYHYTVKLLCDRFGGEPLPNAAFYPCDPAALDGLLDASGLSPHLRRYDLVGSGSPVPGLPFPDDFPATGWLEPARCAALDERLATHIVDPRALDALPDPAWARDALKELEGWLGTCADLGRGLATFYH